MLRMRVGLQHVLNDPLDPLGLIYTPVICRYITKYWLPSHACAHQFASVLLYTFDYLHPLSNY